MRCPGRHRSDDWLVGDIRNAAGCSMVVRLQESVKGAAGSWTDAATGKQGDLLDMIRKSCGLVGFKDVADEAHSFLSLLRPNPYAKARSR